MVLCAEKFIERLNAEGLRYSVNELDGGKVYISLGFGGRSTDFFFDGRDEGSHVAIRTIFDKCPEDRFAELIVVCNALNVEYRWVKFYVDKDNDIMVSDDAIVSPETAGEECFELLVHTISILNDVKPTLMRAIYS